MNLTSALLKLFVLRALRFQALLLYHRFQPVNLQLLRLNLERHLAISTQRQATKSDSGIWECFLASVSCQEDIRQQWWLWQRGMVLETRTMLPQVRKITTSRWVGYCTLKCDWLSMTFSRRCLKSLRLVEMSFHFSTSSHPTTMVFKLLSSLKIQLVLTPNCFLVRVIWASSDGISATVNWSNQWTTRTKVGSREWQYIPTFLSPVAAVVSFVSGTWKLAMLSPRWKRKLQSTTSLAWTIEFLRLQSKLELIFILVVTHNVTRFCVTRALACDDENG